MGLIIGQERHVIKRTDITTEVPTVPASEDFTVGNTFLPTDILVGELYANIQDDKLWIRTLNGIVEIATTASITVPSLATVLLYGNTTGANHLFIGTTKALKSGNGSGQLELDYSGTANEVMLSTDAGGYGAAMLYLTNGYVELSDYTANSALHLGFSDIISAGTLPTVSSGLGDTKANLGVYNSASATFDLIAAGGNMDNTVIVGGTGITATESNTVYTPSIVVQTAKSIKSGNGGGQIDLDFGGVAGSILISTDNAASATPYAYFTANTISLVTGTIHMTLEELNNRISISGPTGFLLGRMTTTEKLALPGANGTIVYDTDLNKFQGYENGSWVNLV